MRTLPLRTTIAVLVFTGLGISLSPACSSSGSNGGTGTSDGSGDTQGGGGQTGMGTGGNGTGASFVGGGATGGGTHGGGTGTGASSSGGGIQFDAGLDASPDAFYENDPPPTTCDGGPPPPVPGGTPMCPDDKNLPGCPCTTVGMTAPCWTYLRKYMGHGDCKDGMTTCKTTTEVGNGVWGDCVGEVGPSMDANATPAAKCECFSRGTWAIANLSPCFVGPDTAPGSQGAISTIMMGMQISCPPISGSGPLTPPTDPWSTDTLDVDCAGHFKLCYTLKAGDSKNKQPTDCTVAQVCVDADYLMPNVKQDFPPLPGWAVSDSAGDACASAFATTGGYGEMSVSGSSILCEDIPDHVFNTVQYCPLSCNMNPNGPGCMGCMSGGSGSF